VKRALLPPLVLIAAAALAACGSTTNTTATSAGLATPGVVVGSEVRPAGAQAVDKPVASAAGSTCEGRPTTASLAPSEPLPAPGHMPAGPGMTSITSRGFLIAGVDQNTLHWGYRDPSTGSFAGFDIDMVRQIAVAIFGDANSDHLHLVVVPNVDRQQAVDSGAVDLVAETMTITCGRQDGSDGQPVDFSSEYYDAHQSVLVPSQSGITSLSGLNGKRVCAIAGSTSLATVKEKAAEAGAHVQPWEAPNETDCLVMLQQGQVEAISTDDTILDGFAAQDPNLRLLPIQLADEPYGMAISPKHPDLVRFVNSVLAHEEPTSAAGTWAGIWRQDLNTPVVPLPPAKYRSS
jgi:polar amino acid transport system substrate-binding protein